MKPTTFPHVWNRNQPVSPYVQACQIWNPHSTQFFYRLEFVLPQVDQFQVGKLNHFDLLEKGGVFVPSYVGGQVLRKRWEAFHCRIRGQSRESYWSSQFWFSTCKVGYWFVQFGRRGDGGHFVGVGSCRWGKLSWIIYNEVWSYFLHFNSYNMQICQK